jgi:hypothetical protein
VERLDLELDPDHMKQYFKIKSVHNLAFFMSEAALFARMLSSHFILCMIPFHVGPGTKSGSGMQCGSGSAKAKWRFLRLQVHSTDVVASE